MVILQALFFRILCTFFYSYLGFIRGLFLGFRVSKERRHGHLGGRPRDAGEAGLSELQLLRLLEALAFTWRIMDLVSKVINMVTILIITYKLITPIKVLATPRSFGL